MVMWAPSRWQVADVLTKPGLEKTSRMIMKSCLTRFSELSAQQQKRDRDSEKQEKTVISM